MSWVRFIFKRFFELAPLTLIAIFLAVTILNFKEPENKSNEDLRDALSTTSYLALIYASIYFMFFVFVYSLLAPLNETLDTGSLIGFTLSVCLAIVSGIMVYVSREKDVLEGTEVSPFEFKKSYLAGIGIEFILMVFTLIFIGQIFYTKDICTIKPGNNFGKKR